MKRKTKLPISEPVKKRLFTMAGNKCAYPKCEESLTFSNENGSSIATGEMCHIRPSKPNGPRGSHPDRSSLDEYDNLILMCPKHHKIIDDSPEVYTVEKLIAMKQEHENVQGNNPLDGPEKEEIQTLTNILKIIDVENWSRHICGFLGAQPNPFITNEFFKTLNDVIKEIALREHIHEGSDFATALACLKNLLFQTIEMVNWQFTNDRNSDQIEYPMRRKSRYLEPSEYNEALEEDIWVGKAFYNLGSEITKFVNFLIERLNSDTAKYDSRRKARRLAWLSPSGNEADILVPRFSHDQISIGSFPASVRQSLEASMVPSEYNQLKFEEVGRRVYPIIFEN